MARLLLRDLVSATLNNFQLFIFDRSRLAFSIRIFTLRDKYDAMTRCSEMSDNMQVLPRGILVYAEHIHSNVLVSR
jgi:hypothetical protein